MGEKENDLMQRYANGKFDELMKVPSHDWFNEDDLVILNNINWVLSNRKNISPLHSLFFD